MAPRGRPSSFKPEYIEQAQRLVALGATDVDIGEFFKVDVRTIYRWKAENEAFCQALKIGKEIADATVTDRLYKRATGYTQDAVKIFMPAGADSPVYAPYVEHHPPDTTACIFWLKNRRPDLWRDRIEHGGPNGGPLVVKVVRFTELDGEVAEATLLPAPAEE